MSFLDGIGGSLISGFASFLGGERRNDAQADQAAQANAFSAQQFATRYQTTVKDMQAAGLNPMLAYSQGGGSPPTGMQAQMVDTVTPAVQSFNQTRSVGPQADVHSAQVANIQADTSNKKAQANLIEAQAAAAWATAGQSNANTSLIGETVNKVKAEVDKLRGDTNFEQQQDILRKTAWNLYQQGAAAQERGISEGQSRALMQATIAKVLNETKLLGLDIDAAKALDNIGRESKQLQPVVEMLINVLRTTRSK